MGIAHNGMGLGGIAYGGGSMTIGGLGTEPGLGSPGTGNDVMSLSLFLAGSPTRATFGNAEVVSLSSMLDQGPESTSDFDPSESRDGSLMDLEEALGAYMGGIGVGGLGPGIPGVIRDSDSGHQRSIRSRSATVSSIRSYGFPGALSASAEAANLSTPNEEDVIDFDALTKPDLVQAETTLNVHDELSNISILAADKVSFTTIASDTNGIKISIVSQSPPPLSLDQSPLASPKPESLSALSSWIAEYHLESDRTRDQKAVKEAEYDHDMDIISALGIADMPEGWRRRDNRITLASALATTPPNPQKPYPRLSIDEEDCCVAPLSNNTSWMDQEEYETIVHIPQGFFLHGRQFQQGYDLDEDNDDETVHGQTHGGFGMGGRRSSFSYLTGLDDHLAPFVDEEVSHLSPIPFAELPSLTNIGLCSHGIVKLSANIRLLGSTTCLQLCCNDLCSVPPEIGYLRNLTLLDLSKNSLTCIPDTIQHLSKLVDLKLSFNFLESLPSTIGQLSKLTGLALDNNRLERIPPQIGMIKGLVTLDLSDNPIQVLPAEIGRLQLLRSLKLDRCPLIDEFSHSPLHSPPTLLELAARVVVRHDLKVPTILPSHLKTYLKTAQRCTFCDGPFFESSCKRGKIIEKNDHCIPLEYTLCHPHWNTEMERVRLLFCPRPPTSPPLPPPVLPTLPSTTSSGNSGLSTSKSDSGSTSRRHSKSGSSQSAATASSSSTVVAAIAASPVASSLDSNLGQHYPTASASSASLSNSSLHWRAHSDATSAAGPSMPANTVDSTPRSRASTPSIRSVSHTSSMALVSSSSSSPLPPPYVLPLNPASLNSLSMPSSSSSSAARSRFSLLMKARDKKRQATTP
ncbi:hypothetical protein BG003_005287 [Podila horticola]|nr:hypothetical protein BG003_005287 [Podila horticola]